MSKAKWGAKRTCQSCHLPYYDMNKKPVTCPKCNTEYDFKLEERKKATMHQASAKKNEKDTNCGREAAPVIVDDDLFIQEFDDDPYLVNDEYAKVLNTSSDKYD